MRKIFALLVLGLALATQAAVTSTATSTTYDCDGTTVDFPTTFRFLAASHLEVSRTDGTTTTALAITTDYTVTGAKAATGSVHLVAGSRCAAGWRLVIHRVVPLQQSTVFRNQGQYLPGTHEDAFDRQMMVAQQQDSELCAIETSVDLAMGPPGPPGPPGPSGGPQGPIGPQGPMGPEGVQGPVGATGPQGATGPTGATGAQGAQGIEGPRGEQGPIGNTGATGATGPQGPQGAGMHWKGHWSAATAYAADDAVVVTAAPNYNAVAILPVGPSATAPVDDPTHWLVLETGLEGPQGPTGATGPAGPQGPTGLTGATGVQGPQGPIGVQGAQGPIGLTGPVGVAGPQGATGQQGPVGPAGPQGPQGAQGVQGPAGQMGPVKGALIALVRWHAGPGFVVEPGAYGVDHISHTTGETSFWMVSPPADVSNMILQATLMDLNCTSVKAIPTGVLGGPQFVIYTYNNASLSECAFSASVWLPSN